MKQFGVAVLLIIFGFFAWLFASRLSSDAVGMAVGLVFGVLSGVPTALLVLAANRQRSSDDEDDLPQWRQQGAIVLDAPSPPTPALPTPPAPNVQMYDPTAFKRPGGRWDAYAYGGAANSGVEALHNIGGEGAHVLYLGGYSIGKNGIYKVEAYRDERLVAVWTVGVTEQQTLLTERVYAPAPSTAIRRVPSCYVRPLALTTRKHDDDGEYYDAVSVEEEMQIEDSRREADAVRQARWAALNLLEQETDDNEDDDGWRDDDEE